MSAAARPDPSHAVTAPQATPAAATDHQPSIHDLPPEVLRLLPKELLEQGPAALLEQLQQYVQLKQQLVSHNHQGIQPEQQESHRRTARVQVVHSDPLHALAAACEEQDGLLDSYEQHCGRSGSGGSSTSCTDPLEVSPKHSDQQAVGRVQEGFYNDIPWSEQAAADAESEGEEQQTPSVHDMAMYIKQLQSQRNFKEQSHTAR